jgi:cytochrome o ubiquinol oxidase subunit 3
MTNLHAVNMEHHDEHHHDEADKNLFGFWLYIMTDCILFSMIFATYIVLHKHVYGGQTAKELFSMPFVLKETLILLTSSFTYGLAMLGANKQKSKVVLFWLLVTFVLGAAFIAMELHEFTSLYHEGNSWSRSAFLSSFFTLVGTHGLHVTAGLIWMIVVMLQVLVNGVTPKVHSKLAILSLFWHFLDIVWIFVFTIVYLMGAI